MIKKQIQDLIEFIGDDPDRHELSKTPDNFIKYLQVMFSGYNHDQPVSKGSLYENTKNSQELVILKHVSFVSHCEHHIAPITGKISVGYIPGKYLISIGSITRTITMFTRRLQIQERIGRQIVDYLQERTGAQGGNCIYHSSTWLFDV